MIGQFNFCEKGWVTGKGRAAIWRDIPIPEQCPEPQFLMADDYYGRFRERAHGVRLGFMDVTSATNARTMIASAKKDIPSGNSAPSLSVLDGSISKTLLLEAVCNSLCFDFCARQRTGGLHLNWYIVSECPIPMLASSVERFTDKEKRLILCALRLTFITRWFSTEWLKLKQLYPELASEEWKHWWAVTEADRLRLWVEIDALCADLYGLDPDDFDWIVRDDPTDPKGFYRVDRKLPFRERLTGLAAAAFRALKEGKWSAETAASLSNDEFFDLLGIPELTNARAAHAKGLPGPLIEKRDGCHIWKPEDFPKNDPRHGWTWDDCWKDAVALLGSEEAVRCCVEEEPKAAQAADDEQPFRLQAKKSTRSQGKLF